MEFNKIELHKLAMNQAAQKAQGGKPSRKIRGNGKGRGGGNAQISQLATSIVTLQSSVEKVGGSLKKTNQNVNGMMKKINYGSDDNSLFSTDEDEIRPGCPGFGGLLSHR